MIISSRADDRSTFPTTMKRPGPPRHRAETGNVPARRLVGIQRGLWRTVNAACHRHIRHSGELKAGEAHYRLYRLHRQRRLWRPIRIAPSASYRDCATKRLVSSCVEGNVVGPVIHGRSARIALVHEQICHLSSPHLRGRHRLRAQVISSGLRSHLSREGT